MGVLCLTLQKKIENNNNDNFLLWVIDDCWVFVTFMREEREAASGALLLELLFKLLPTKNVI